VNICDELVAIPRIWPRGDFERREDLDLGVLPTVGHLGRFYLSASAKIQATKVHKLLTVVYKS
jgi:hypothetical protein